MEKITGLLQELDRQLQHRPYTNSSEGTRQWSMEGYIKRARSFHWSWASRVAPADVSTCARYGWYQRGHDDQNSINTMVCTTCGGRLFLPWDDEMLPEAQATLAAEYYEKISMDGHLLNGNCPWRVAPCRIEMTRITFTSRRDELIQLKGRIDSWMDVGDIMRICSVENPILDKIAQLGRRAFPDVQLGVILLALLHWVRKDNSVICAVGCCELPLQRDGFDPVDGHAYYCPLVFGIPPPWYQLEQALQITRVDISPILSSYTVGRIKELLNQ